MKLFRWLKPIERSLILLELYPEYQATGQNLIYGNNTKVITA
jgi:hypothetical protein